MPLEKKKLIIEKKRSRKKEAIITGITPEESEKAQKQRDNTEIEKNLWSEIKAFQAKKSIPLAQQKEKEKRDQLEAKQRLEDLFAKKEKPEQ